MGRGRGVMVSSFTSISFATETAMKFRDKAQELKKSHTELLEELLK